MKSLSEQFNSHSIAIIGMCKNAGKTTVLNELIGGMTGCTLGLTSIGRDGEAVDVATVTPKPDVYVREGTLFATAAYLLKYCDTTLEILDTSNISTPLGEVVYAKARSDGNIQIAGASTVEGLKSIYARLMQFEAQTVIFDGAISRKSLSVPSLCNELVLCTGASYSPSITKTVTDTAFIAKLFCLDIDKGVYENKSKIALYSGESCLGLEGVSELKQGIKTLGKTEKVRIRGAVTDTLLKALLESGMREVDVIIDDPCKLLADQSIFAKCGIRDIRFFVSQKAALRAVTVNPFSAYGNSYDSEMLFEQMCIQLDGTGIAIYDVKGNRAYEN